MITMPRRPAWLDDEVVPTCAEFLRALLSTPGTPARLAEKIVLARTFTSATSPPENQQRTVVSWLRRMTRKDDPAYPESRTVWSLADHMRSIGHGWCAGPLMLYATGHFREFVHVVGLLGRETMPLRDRLAELDAAIRMLAKFEAFMHLVRHSSLDADQKDAVADARRLEALWSLSSAETQQFEAAWRRFNRGEPLPDAFRLEAALMLARAPGRLYVKRFAIIEQLVVWLDEVAEGEED